MDLQMKLAADGLAAVYKSPESGGAARVGALQGHGVRDDVRADRDRLQQAAGAGRRTCRRRTPISPSSSTPRPTSTRRRSPTYDAEKSGVGFMLVNQDAKLNPAFWDLVKAMGARGANMQSSTGTMMERDRVRARTSSATTSWARTR